MIIDRTITRVYSTTAETEKIYCDYFASAVKTLGVEHAQSYPLWVNYIVDTVDDEMLVNEYGFKITEELTEEEEDY